MSFRSAMLILTLFPLAAVAQSPLRLEVVATGLVRPTHVAAPAGDLQRVFLVEENGRVRIVKNGVLLPAPFLDLTAGFVVSFSGELGMLGLTFHPNFATNGFVYVFYTGFPWPRAYVKRFTVSAADPDVVDPASGVSVLETQLIYGNHNAGMITFGRDGYLYISLGDGGSFAPTWPDDPQNSAQRTDTLLGKILRIDVDHPAPPLAYGIPPSNPFVGAGDPLDEIWAMGLRNPWRFSFDRLTGDLYIGDVGGMHEEIDYEPAGSPGGRNYGWSCMSGTFCNTNNLVCACHGANLTVPLHDYSSISPAGAVIGGYVYRGIAAPDWRGAYFFGDFARKKVWALRHNGSAVTQLVDLTAQLAPPPPSTLVGISSFGEDAYGELYLCDIGGSVYRIAPVAPAVVGVAHYGVGTPGCSGSHTLTAINSPVIGNPAFTLRTSQAPVFGFGLLGVASQGDVAGSDPFGIGLLMHLQVANPLLLTASVFSDGNGVGNCQFGIPPSSVLAGLSLHAQTVWFWDALACTPSLLGLSSSPGLQFDLQP